VIRFWEEKKKKKVKAGQKKTVCGAEERHAKAVSKYTTRTLVVKKECKAWRGVVIPNVGTYRGGREDKDIDPTRQYKHRGERSRYNEIMGGQGAFYRGGCPQGAHTSFIFRGQQ